MRWFRKCTSIGSYFSSLTSYKPCNFLKRSRRGVSICPKIWYVGRPRCADSENVPLSGLIFRPLRVTSLVTFAKELAGYFDLPQIWYVGPPRCADSENVPLWGGIFRPLRVTSLVTFVKEWAGYFDLPQIYAVCRASSMRWFPKCTSIGWYLSSLTSYKPCNFCKGGVFRFVPNLVCRPPQCADSKNVPLWGGIFRPLRVTSLVTFVKESAGYLDLPQSWYVGPPWCADSENIPL